MKRIKLPGVYLSQNRKYWLYKPYIKKKDRLRYSHIQTDKNGFTKTITLGETSEPEWQIRKRHAEETEALYRTVDQYTLDWLFEKYKESRNYRKLSRSTQKRYDSAGTRLLNYTGESAGKPMRLGEYDCRNLTTPMIRAILDKSKAAFERKAPDNPYHGNSELNNQLATLAAMYKYGIQYHEDIARIGKRPTEGIEKFPTRTRDHCPSREDYAIVYAVAKETAPAYVSIAMELAKYLASRGIEITDELTVSDRKQQPDGTYIIDLKRRKGSKKTKILCGDELNAAWKAAIALHNIQPIGTTPLLVNSRGSRLTRATLTNAWGTLKETLEKRGLAQHYFQFHDLKRWGITHSKDKRIAGQSLAMQQRYDQEEKVFNQPRDE